MYQNGIPFRSSVAFAIQIIGNQWIYLAPTYVSLTFDILFLKLKPVARFADKGKRI